MIEQMIFFTISFIAFFRVQPSVIVNYIFSGSSLKEDIYSLKFIYMKMPRP